MAKILVADEISKEGLNILSKSLDVEYLPDVDETKLLEIIPGFDALLVRSRTRVNADVLRKGTKLKVVGRAGVGVDNIDLAVATECGILVLNSPEGNTASAAEHTLALMLSLARAIPAADASLKSGQWERTAFTGSELFNKSLGVVGLGKVGSRVAACALALGMKVLVYDPLVSSEKLVELGYETASLEDIWRKADIITIHTPLTRETKNLIDAGVFSKLKPGVRIINAARGGIIDELALAAAIEKGQVAGAALDVFEKEPPVGSPLLRLGQRVVLTPHLGALTVEAQSNVAIDLAEQIRDFIKSGIVRSPVNLPAMRPELVKSLGKYIRLAEILGAILGELSSGNLKSFEICARGGLANKDISPLVVSALKGLFSTRVECITYVNAELTARQHGLNIQERKLEETEQFHDELALTTISERETSSITGTVLAHDEPIISKINGNPINLTPSKYMLFTMHHDQPGVVAKVSGVLGKNNVNISTMAVGRREIRAHAVMVMTLDDPLTPNMVSELSSLPGINSARYVSLS